MNYLKSKIKNEQRKIEQLSRNRLILGLVILACWIIPVFQKDYLTILYPLSFVFIIGFVVLVYLQVRRKDFRAYLDQRLFLKGRWHSHLANSKPEALRLTANPLWEDLDIFHDNALFAKLNITKNFFSAQKLIEWMGLQTNDAGLIKNHQKQVQFLYQKKGLRKILLTLYARHADSFSEENLKSLLKKSLLENTQVYKYLVGFYMLLWALYIGFIFFAMKPFYILGWIFLVILMGYAGTKIKVMEAYPWVNSFDAQLSRFKKTFKYKERLGFVSEEQKKMIAELDKISSALGVRQNYIVYAIIHALVPWDFYWTLRLTQVQHLMREKLPQWLEEVAQLEAYLQIAEFSENLKKSCWPEIQDVYTEVVITDGFHPLMSPDKAVANSLELRNQDRKMMLITGSNMAGKSTFLRTLAMNQLLSQIGAKVCAKSYKTSAFVILTSLKRTDSLEDAFSTFYSEVKNLKWILDISSASPSLYFIDEIFRGTNNKERLLGAQKYIQKILKTKSMGCITSHDLELAQMEKELAGIFNEHFADRVEGGKMLFDYLKKPGPCPTTNALKVMEMEGLF